MVIVITQERQVIVDPSVTSGTQLADIITKNTQSELSSDSGAARPPYAEPGMVWVDTSDPDLQGFMFYDGATDILIGQFDTVNKVFIPAGIDPADFVPIAGNVAMQGPLAVQPPVSNDEPAQKGQLDAHTGNNQNPHGVTAEQVGAPSGRWDWDGTTLYITIP